MHSPWWVTDYEYSLLHQLQLRGFRDMTFSPLGPGQSERDDGNRFHLGYPNGQFEKPCFGIEYNASVPSRSGSVGLFSQSSTFTLFVLGSSGEDQDIKRKMQEAIRILGGEAIPLYAWDEKAGKFGTPWIVTLKARYAGDQMKSSHINSDKPEGTVQFVIDH